MKKARKQVVIMLTIKKLRNQARRQQSKQGNCIKLDKYLQLGSKIARKQNETETKWRILSVFVCDIGGNQACELQERTHTRSKKICKQIARTLQLVWKQGIC